MGKPVSVFIWDWSSLAETEVEKIKSVLPESDLDPLQKMASQKRKSEYLTGRLLIRQATKKSDEIKYSEQGKPYFMSGPEFSLSHSKSVCFLAVSENPVGADVQFQDNQRDVKNIVAMYGRPNELKVFESLKTDEEQRSYFFSLWSSKESVAKAEGKGIDPDFRNIEFVEFDDSKKLSVRNFQEGSYQFSVSSTQKIEKIDFYKTLFENNGLLSFHMSPPTAEVKALSVLGR